MARIRTSLAGERVGLFTMDPGQTTGITWSTPLLKGTIKEIFDRDVITVDEVSCLDPDVPDILTERSGVKVIAETYREQQAEWILAGIPTTRHFFVYEDFVLAPGHHSSERSGLSPVRVTSLLQGMLVTDQINWVAQSPSMAKSTITNDRLRRWDIWTRGMVHGRDATRHAALWCRQAMR